MNFNIDNILAWLLAAFFFLGGAVNAVAPKKVRDEYARWGYPNWFHYVTAMAELVTAVLLLFSATRMLGLGLGAAVMMGAVATVLRHREYGHAIPPAIVFFFAIACGWLMIGK